MHRSLATAGLLSLCLVPSVSWAETITLTLRNGDSLHGELIERNPNNGTTVLNHPQLGRLEVTAEQLKPATTKPLWVSSMSAGVIGNEKDGDTSLSVSFTGKTRYKDEQQKLSLSGSFNASKSKDAGEALSIDTEKGSAELRYDKSIGSNLDLFALSSYQYNGTNDSGVNTVLGNIGVAFPLLKSDTTELTVSIGPSLRGPDDLVPEFDPSTGIEFLSTDSEGDDVICTIRLRCLLKKRTLGQAPRPYWDLEAVLDLRLRRGTWKVLRSREVNHSDRGRA